MMRCEGYSLPPDKLVSQVHLGNRRPGEITHNFKLNPRLPVSELQPLVPGKPWDHTRFSGELVALT